jgi:hypothetical protein
MNAVFLLICLTGLPDGTLIFNEHSSTLVELKTKSPITHVAIIFNENDISYVYEATFPKVKRVSLDEYIKKVKIRKLEGRIRIQVWAAKPNFPYKREEIRAMKGYADSQLEKKYSVKSYDGLPTDGLHCGEYVVNSLVLSSRYTSSNSGRTSPKTLWTLPGYDKKLKIQ